MTRAVLAAAALASSLLAAAAPAAPLRADHPLVGTWTLALVKLHCTETMIILASGRSNVTSGAEVSESEIEVSDIAAANGFYRWVDTVRKTNGEEDCGGQVTPIGDVATSYIRVDPAGKSFVSCFDETPQTCVGPYIRQDGAGH